MKKAAVLSILVAVAVLAVGAIAEAQRQKVPRIAYLHPGPAAAVSARMEAFRQGLRELGYVEGKKIVIGWRWAEGKPDRLPALAAGASAPQGRLHRHGRPNKQATSQRSGLRERELFQPPFFDHERTMDRNGSHCGSLTHF